MGYLRRHILEEFTKLLLLEARDAQVLVGIIDVVWGTPRPTALKFSALRTCLPVAPVDDTPSSLSTMNAWVVKAWMTTTTSSSLM